MEKEYEKTHSEKIAAELIKAIREGTAPWQRPWQPGEAMASAPYNPFTGNQYRGSNSLYLRLCGSQYEDPRWLTYKQAQEMGAQVRKGESGLTVQYVKKGEMRDVLDEEGNPKLDENGEIMRKFHIYDKPCVFSARVFNAEQIDGMPPLPPLEERLPPPGEINDRVEAILQASEADIRHSRGNRAFYSPTEDYIMLPERDQFNSQAGYYATALHELGHWTGHFSRLGRDLSNPFGSTGYAKEELRAEISSFMNAQRYGIPHDPSQHASYVASWLKVLEDDPQEIIHASADAASISNYIATFDRHLEQHQEIDRKQQQQERQTMTINEPVAQAAAPNVQTAVPEARIYLDVPYAEKNQAKALGARWDSREKSWYIPPDVDPRPLQKWMAGENIQHEAGKQNIDASVRAVLQQYLADNLDVQQWSGVTITKGVAQYMGTGVIFTDDMPLPAQGWMVFAINNDNSRTLLLDTPSQDDAYALADALDSIGKQIWQKTDMNIAHIAEKKTFLAVPFEEKEDAKALGAKWDGVAKSWYAPEGVDLAPLQKWIPQNRVITAPVNSDPMQEFALALASAGLVVKDIQADGQLHRVPVEGRPHGRDGAYKLHLDGLKPAGFIQNFVTGHKENWKHDNGQRLSPEEIAQQRAQLAAQKAEREREREALQLLAQRKAIKEWEQAPYADSNHPYLVRKELDFDIVNKLGIRQDKRGNLLIPMINKDFQIQSLQRIGANGFKQFESGCKVSGCFTILGDDYPGEYKPRPGEKLNPDKAEPIIISTGVATGASIYMATGEPVVIAFQDANLKEVAEELKAMYPYRSFFIAGDNDQHNVAKGLKNGGLESAKAAAKAVGGHYAVPQFASNQVGKEFSDFSDLHRIAGLAAVKRQLQAGLSIARGNVAEDKERQQAQKQSQERMQEKEVRQRKADEENAQKKRRSRSM